MAEYRWYVAGALAGLEGTALYHLKRAGIVAFSPTAVIDGRNARLFPGYVFVELASTDEAGIVNRQRGIHKMLPTHANAPLPLPKGFVEDLLVRIAGGDFTERSAEEVVYKFAPQEEVFIKTGPFRDHRGRFLRFSKGCGIVLASLLGRELELKIPARELAPVRWNASEPKSRSVGDAVAA